MYSPRQIGAANTLLGAISKNITDLFGIFRSPAPDDIRDEIVTILNEILHNYRIQCKSVDGALFNFNESDLERVHHRDRRYNSPVTRKRARPAPERPILGPPPPDYEVGVYPVPRRLFHHPPGQPQMPNIFSAKSGGKRRATRRRQ